MRSLIHGAQQSNPNSNQDKTRWTRFKEKLSDWNFVEPNLLAFSMMAPWIMGTFFAWHNYRYSEKAVKQVADASMCATGNQVRLTGSFNDVTLRAYDPSSVMQISGPDGVRDLTIHLDGAYHVHVIRTEKVNVYAFAEGRFASAPLLTIEKSLPTCPQ